MTRHPMLLTLLAWVVLLAGAAALGHGDSDQTSVSDVVWLLSWLGFALVGALALEHRPGHAVGRLLLVGGLATPCANLLGLLALRVDSGLISALSLMAYAVGWVTATALVLLVYPDGKLPSPRWRWVFATGVACIVVVCCAVLVNPQPQDPATQIASPLAITALGDLPGRVIDAGVLVAGLVTLLALISLTVRWRRADGLVRAQLGWLCLGGLTIALVALAAACVAVWWPDHPEAVGTLMEATVLLVLPVVTGIAMLRHRLFDTDVMLRRSLVAVLLGGFVLLVYIAVLSLATLMTGRAAGAGAAVVAAVLVGVSLVPLRTWLNRRIERLLYGVRRHPDRALAVVPAGLSSATDDADVLALAAHQIRTSMALGYVAVLRPDGTVAADSGADPGTGTITLPLRALGVDEGTLVVGSSRDDRLGPNDRELLTGLASQVALLARAVRLSTALQGSRERLVGAREDERRRLRRDLHDGLGPVLAGLTLQVDALSDHLDPNRTEALDLAARIKTELRGAIGSVRHSVDGLRPPDLDQLGLVGALGERARTMSTGPTSFTVAGSLRSRLAAATEVAAYRIAAEAMTNTARHAGASRCDVTLDTSGTDLVVRIADNGHGIGEQPPGVGLASMRERAAEVGGRLAIRSDSSGTVVEATLPREIGR